MPKHMTIFKSLE